LEGHYNSVIRGEPGKMQVLVDANGHAYHRQEQAPQPGASLITTIDSQIQFIVQDEMLKLVEKTNAAAISIIVMDPNSGAILAMANHPTFNPNRVNGSPASSWMNSSVGLTFEPGSTFKIVPIAAALEEGVTTPDEMIYCENGAIYVHGRRIKDHDPYGWLTVREIMQNSSNVGAIKLALLLREERLKKYIDRYGFGEKTMVDLPGEVPGTVRPVSNWTKTSIASVAIGQEIAVTPLQIVSLVATVANGGTRYKPYVVQKIQDAHGGTVEIRPKGERVMSTTTAQSLRGMLEDVVTNGTAKTSQLDGYRAAGKTGTADKIDPATGRYTKYVASFAGFAPAGDPRLAIIVVVDEPKGQYYGGQVAAPSFKRIAEKALRLMSVPPDFPRDTPHYTAVPRKGSKPSTPPSSRQREFKVLDVALSPVQAEGANPSTGLGSVVVPDLYGKSLRDATTESGSLGLEPVFNGSGRVIGQSPPPGSRVKPGTRIHFQLSLR
jgi:cell division protein FtsI (penicillin-binding protein 3)